MGRDEDDPYTMRPDEGGLGDADHRAQTVTPCGKLIEPHGLLVIAAIVVALWIIDELRR